MSPPAQAEVIELPRRPPAEPGSGGANAQARAPAREERRHLMPSATAVNGVLAGSSVLHTPPPAIMAVWAQHCAAARYYNGWILRWPRFIYGAWHTWTVAAPAYFIVWATDSMPKLMATVAVLALTVWLLAGR